MNQAITTHLDAIKGICYKHHVKLLFVIGSAARDTMKADSDVDLLYSFREDDIPDGEYADNFFDFQTSLQQLLKTRIDLVAADYLKNPYFINHINKDKVLIYEG